jgi:hypothetical protein
LFFCLPFFFDASVLANSQTVQLEKRYDLPSAADLNQSKANCRGGICADNMMNFQLNSLAGAASCTLGGLICGAKDANEQSMYIQKSVLGQTGQVMAFLYTQPPATTNEYLAWLGNRAGLVPKSYAQGVAHSRLLPILPIWKVFRDIAFVLLTIIMLLIGLMIMFRAKVNPQTVASVENTIPKLVVTIILIWLSFPIAALIIDLMYVLIVAGIGLIGNAVGDTNLDQAIKSSTTGGLGALFVKTMTPSSEFIKLGLPGIIGSIGGFASAGKLQQLFHLDPNFIVKFVSGLLGAAVAGKLSGGNSIMQMLSPIYVLCILLILFFSIFRIFFMLLSAYIQILISVIFAPLFLLLNALPGKDTFSSWIKGLITNILSFVITAIMLYLSWAIASLIKDVSFWTPPFIIQGAGAPEMAIGMISIGVVILIPQVIEMTKQALSVKTTFQVGPGTMLQPITSTISSLGTFATSLDSLDRITSTGKGGGLITKLKNKIFP